MRKIKLLSLAVAIFFVVIVAVAMAAPQLSSVPTPTFQARTRLVQVDVIVRNKNGPVMMLNQDDFTLLDNGKPQKISIFAVKGTPSSRQSAVPLPPGTVSNRVTRNGLEAASSTVILIDEINTPPGDQGYAKRKIVKFLENRRSQDRMGIYEFGKGVRMVQDLTDDPDLLSQAINSLKTRVGWEEWKFRCTWKVRHPPLSSGGRSRFRTTNSPPRWPRESLSRFPLEHRGQLAIFAWWYRTTPRAPGDR